MTRPDPYPTPSGWNAPCGVCDFVGRGFDESEARSERIEHYELAHAGPVEREAAQ